jgi:hypothetical protein
VTANKENLMKKPYGAVILSQSRMLLLRDLVRLGIVAPPTVEQMADLIIQAASGAMKGLAVLGYSRAEGQVAASLIDIRNTLNELLH